MKYIVVLVLLATAVVGQCYEPSDGAIIEESVTFCSDTFDIPNGVQIVGRDIVVDCNSGVLRGFSGTSNVGIYLLNSKNVTFKDCNIVTFDTGILVENTTHSTIDSVGLLKNKIGLRFLNSYENTVVRTNDKSRVKAVSMITSKFNTVILNNKQLHEPFCEMNACNSYGALSPCQDNDFYCSENCDEESDNDCGELVIEELPVIEKGKTVEEIIAEVQQEQQPRTQEITETKEKRRIPIGIKLIAYLITYLVAFILLRSQKRG